MNNEVPPIPDKLIEKKKPLSNLPEPKKILSLALITVIGLVIIKFWPVIVFWVLGDYSQKNPTDVGPVIVVMAAVIGVLFLLLVGIWSVRGIWWPFLRASLTNNIVMAAFTKNKILSFVVPKDINWNHIKIDNDTIIDPDPDSRYTAPNKVPVLPFIPDYAKTIDPRSLLLGNKKDYGIDITTLGQVGRINRLIGYEKARNPLSAMISSGLFWLLMAGGILFLVMWPYFSQQMDQTSKVSGLQDKVLQCNQRLITNNLQPIGVDLSTPTTTQPTAKPAEPTTGVTSKPK